MATLSKPPHPEALQNAESFFKNLQNKAREITEAIMNNNNILCVNPHSDVPYIQFNGSWIPIQTDIEELIAQIKDIAKIKDIKYERIKIKKNSVGSQGEFFNKKIKRDVVLLLYKRVNLKFTFNEKVYMLSFQNDKNLDALY